jgi:hypothetical protein
MSCECSPKTTKAETDVEPRSDDRAGVLLEFAQWDIENLWQNCQALGYSNEEIRSTICALAEKLARQG